MGKYLGNRSGGENEEKRRTPEHLLEDFCQELGVRKTNEKGTGYNMR
jgi:hypothetical protein